MQIGSALAPTLTDLVDRAKNVGKVVVDWVRENQGLVKGIAIGITAVGVFGAALVAVGTAISVAGTALGAIGSVLGFVFSPLGIFIGLIAATGAYLYQFGAVGSEALQWIKDKLQPLTERATESFQSIKDALAAGDWKLAAKVLWLSLKEAWLSGTQELTTLWIGFFE